MIDKKRVGDSNYQVTLLAGYSHNNLPGRVNVCDGDKTFRGFVERESSGFQRVALHVQLSYGLEVALTWQCNTTAREYRDAGEWYAFQLEICVGFTDNIVAQLGAVRAFAAKLEKTLVPGEGAQPEDVVQALGGLGFVEVVHDDRLSEWVKVGEVLLAEYTGWATGYSVEPGRLWARAIARDGQGAQAAILIQAADHKGMMGDDYLDKVTRWQKSGMPVVPYGGKAGLSIVGQLAAHRLAYSLPTWGDEQRSKALALPGSA